MFLQLKNPIYLFYDAVPKNAEGTVGKLGDKHYKCRHGNRKIITITKGMRYNVGSKSRSRIFIPVLPIKSIPELTTHLKNDFPIMYRLFLALYTRKDVPPTEAEVNLARGNVPADGNAAKEYLGKVETATSSIMKGLERQAKKVQVYLFIILFRSCYSLRTQGNFEQEVFNRLLAEWIVACDQPFDEVEKPEFIRLMEYTHHGSTLNFKVPGHTAVRNRVMKMGEDTVEGTKKMFSVCICRLGVDRGLMSSLRSSTQRSACRWTRGHPATSTLFLPLLLTM